MRAAVCRAFGEPLTIEEVVLRAPGAGEVQVAVEAVAICHSDLGYIDGQWASQLPAVYGHEAAGRITVLGEGVTGFAVGFYAFGGAAWNPGLIGTPRAGLEGLRTDCRSHEMIRALEQLGFTIIRE